jgi:hypothetical protein
MAGNLAFSVRASSVATDLDLLGPYYFIEIAGTADPVLLDPRHPPSYPLTVPVNSLTTTELKLKLN